MTNGPLQFARDLVLSVRAAPMAAVRNAAIGGGFVWAAVEPAAFFIGWLEKNKMPLLLAALLVVAVVWVRSTHHPRHRQIERFGTRIEVSFGDLFDTEGVRIIAVNDFFDGQLDAHVARSSLHGQLIIREYGGEPGPFRTDVDRSLKTATPERVRRASGRGGRYRIGTTATVHKNGHTYVLVALGSTDDETAKVSATIAQLAQCLDSAWVAARASVNGDAIVCPLMGSGLSGINMTAPQLASLILASALEATGRQKVSHAIRLVLPEAQYGRIHLDRLLHPIKD